MNIREFDLQDSEHIKDLLCELQEYVIEIDKYNLNIISEDYREKYFDYMMNDCKNQRGKVFVALNGETIVGFIAGFVQTYDIRDTLDYVCPKKGIVAELIVSKKHRSAGSGQLLLNKIENYFMSVGCQFVQIDVFAYNNVAKNFYYKNNYEDRMITLFKKID